MITLLNTTIDARTSPVELERIRRNLVDAVTELQRQSLAFAKRLTVTLKSGVETPVFHNLGRTATVFVSLPPVGVSLAEVTGTAYSSDKYVVLKATGGDAVVALAVF